MTDTVNRKLGRLVAVCLAVTQLLASEHHGIVQSGGLPIPGATVTAAQGDKKLATTTDEQGAYSFPNLADGVWTVQVEMMGFAKATNEIGIAPQAPSPTWELKQLSAVDLKASLAPPVPPAPASVPAAPAATTAEAPKAAPNTPAQDRPQLVRRQQQQTQNAAGGRGGRGNGAGTGFQRVDVNASENAGDATNPGNVANELAALGNQPDLAQSANDALVIGGSVSSGIGMAQQDDWGFGGRGGFGPGGMGPDGMGFGPGMVRG